MTSVTKVLLRFFTAVLHNETIQFFFFADLEPSYVINSSSKDANEEPKDGAMPDGMCHSENEFWLYIIQNISNYMSTILS